MRREISGRFLFSKFWKIKNRLLKEGGFAGYRPDNNIVAV